MRQLHCNESGSCGWSGNGDLTLLHYTAVVSAKFTHATTAIPRTPTIATTMHLICVHRFPADAGAGVPP